MTYNVLLVDDEYMILAGLQKIINWQNLGFNVVATAENAMQGLSILETQPIDLVVTDVTMPEMNGLEFIEAAQKEHFFEFMILSGYQEFDYLKSGMQLGAVNYLMKPVNKAELITSLETVKKRLDHRRQQKNQQEVYQEILFSQWLNDELDEPSEEELLEKLGKRQRRVLLAQVPRQAETTISQWLTKRKEPFYYQRNYGELVLFVLLLQEEAVELFSHFVEQSLMCENWLISIGDESCDPETIPQSFQHAKDNLQLHQFYGDQNQRIFYAEQAEIKQSIDFISFSRVLKSGQLALAQQMISDFFEQFQQAVMSPEDIRHFSFLLFMDIYRELIRLEDDEYLTGIQKINQAKSVQELHQLLLSLLENQHNQKYSQNVEKVLQILHEKYKEPLTLKEVAEHLHLNVMYLGQLFKKETKKSFSAYLNHLRMEQAKWLLIHSNQNINEISNEIGYNNTTYFSKLFKKIVGQSPSEYRENQSQTEGSFI